MSNVNELSSILTHGPTGIPAPVPPTEDISNFIFLLPTFFL